jgi:hypothetical protein
MPITPTIEPGSYPAIRAKIPRTIKKASVLVSVLTLLQKTIKQRKQRRRTL